MTTLSVGDVVVVGCARVRIDAVIDASNYEVTYIHGDLLDHTIPNDPNQTVVPIAGGEWSWVTPTGTLGGLEHLEGKEVWALADGNVMGPLVVSEGEAMLSETATFACVVVGLSYTSQLKTLYLTVEGLLPGTIQGKRKFTPAATLRVDCTLGLSAGIDFDHLTPVPDLQGTEPFTGDARVVVFGDWTERAEVCVEQTAPLPATVLGIITEVTAGDTGR